MKHALPLVALFVSSQCHATAVDCKHAASELKRMVAVDQAVRTLVQPQDLVASASKESEMPRSVQRMAVVDRVHEGALVAIIRQCGWPRRSKDGEAATGAAWMLVQHARQEVQREFLPLLQTAVAAGEASGSDVAYLTDRVLLGEGKAQIYGTQLDLKEPCQIAFAPIDDRNKVNERRKEVGMPSLEQYESLIREHFASQGCQPK